MGWVSNFLASPVLEGFVFAFGLGLIADQLHKILGIAKVEGSYWEKLIGTLKELPQTDPSTLAVGGTAVALLLVMRFFAPRLPRAIMVVILGTIVVPLFDLTSHGVAVVGDLPSGLPSLTLPTGLSLDQWSGAVRRLARRRLRGIQRVPCRRELDGWQARRGVRARIRNSSRSAGHTSAPRCSAASPSPGA